jgi:two-component system LytT family response regulator
MKHINAIIIDDEAHARAALKGIVEENIENVRIVDEAKNLPDGVKLIKKHQPQIVFLDIEMPAFSGLEILDFFNEDEVNFKIIFVTAYNQYALDAFRLSAIDYLVKPVQLEDLKRAVNKCVPSHSNQVKALKSLMEDNEEERKIVLSVNGAQEIINMNDIMYVKADGSYSDVILTNKKLCITKRLSEFEKLQNIGPFMRIHRSQIININHIKKISKADGGSVFMTDGAELSISKEKREELDQLLKLVKI